MADIMVIDMVDVTGGYMKMLLYLQNSMKRIFVLNFQDYKEALKARQRINDLIIRRSSWFNMLVAQRGCDVYIVKLQGVQKVVIRDGK